MGRRPGVAIPVEWPGSGGRQEDGSRGSIVGRARSGVPPAGPPAAGTVLLEVPFQQGARSGYRPPEVRDVRRGPARGRDLAKSRRDPRQGGDAAARKPVSPRADDRQALRGWVGRYLDFEAHASAGDPGRVVLRRLSNVEYSNTIRDLTGFDLDPAREFPQDGAAGEGFTNTGDALVMSPSLLTKYFDAAKGVAAHAVLLPDGFRFSLRRDPSRLDRRDRRRHPPPLRPLRRQGRQAAAGTLPGRDHRAARQDGFRPGQGGRNPSPGRETRPESPVSRHALGHAQGRRGRGSSRWRHRRFTRAVADRQARRRAGARRCDPAVAVGALEFQDRRVLVRRHLAGPRQSDGRLADLAAQDPGLAPIRGGRALPVGRRCRRRSRRRRRRLERAQAGDPRPAAALAPRRPPARPIPGRPAAGAPGRDVAIPGRRRGGAAGLRPREGRGAGQETRRPGRCPGRVARLPRACRRRARQDRHLFHQEDRSRRWIRIHPGLGLRRDAQPDRQFLRPGGECPRPDEAAQRRRASVAEPDGLDRMAEPDRRPRPRRRDGGRRARRLRQRRRLVAGAAPRRPPSPTGRWRHR